MLQPKVYSMLQVQGLSFFAILIRSGAHTVILDTEIIRCTSTWTCIVVIRIRTGLMRCRHLFQPFRLEDEIHHGLPKICYETVEL
jgi:hypothetical protein